MPPQPGKRIIRPPANLAPRPGHPRDEELTFDQLRAVFQLKEKQTETLSSLPGALVLRYYGTGEEICHQADPGWTAFRILTPKELLSLREAQRQEVEAPLQQAVGRTAPPQTPDSLLGERKQFLDGEIGRLTQLLASRSKAAEAALVRLEPPGRAQRPRWFGRWRKPDPARAGEWPP